MTSTHHLSSEELVVKTLNMTPTHHLSPGDLVVYWSTWGANPGKKRWVVVFDLLPTPHIYLCLCWWAGGKHVPMLIEFELGTIRYLCQKVNVDGSLGPVLPGG